MRVLVRVCFENVLESPHCLHLVRSLAAAETPTGIA